MTQKSEKRTETTAEEDFIKALREKVAIHLKDCGKKLNNEDLATELDISVSRLSHLKRGESGDLSPYVLKNLARHLRVTVDDLLREKDLVSSGQSKTQEMERASFIEYQTAMVHGVLARQDAVRSATAEIGKAIVETLERRSAEIENLIESQNANYIVPATPNQISKPEIVEFERSSAEVWVSTSRHLPYLNLGINTSSEFLGIEFDGINKGRNYRYFIEKQENDTATREGFMNLVWDAGDGSVSKERFIENFRKYVKIEFSDDEHRPVFSWALHKLDPKEKINPWLQLRYGSYIHDISFKQSDGTYTSHGKWIGHMCFSLPEENIFILMHKEMLVRAHVYFEAQMKEGKKR